MAYEELFEAQAYDHPLLVLELTGTLLRRLVAAAGECVVTSGLDSARRPDAVYEVLASELLLDHLPLPARPPARRAGTEVEALAASAETRLR